MRILHVSLGWPPFRSGGLVRYCCDLMDEQVRQGHVVGMLYPAGYRVQRNAIIRRSERNGVCSYALYSRNFVPLVFGVADPATLDCSVDGAAYELVLNSFNPDVIHVHTIQGIGERFFRLAKERRIKMLFTTHDYYPLCLRCNMMDVSGLLCSHPSPKKCAQCNKGSGLSAGKGAVMQSPIYRILKGSRLVRSVRTKAKSAVAAKEEYARVDTADVQAFGMVTESHRRTIRMMDVIHANSELAGRIYQKFVPDIEHLVLPITHAGLEFKGVRKKIHSPLRIGYVGGANEYKGYRVLLEALKKLEFDWTLDFFGTPLGEDDLHDERIVCHGFYSPEKSEDVFSAMDVLVVPSVWPETFGFVVLESICVGTPVICSERVGASYLLPSENIFKINEPATLIKCLNNVVAGNELPQTTSNNLKHLVNMTSHAKKISEIYSRMHF